MRLTHPFAGVPPPLPSADGLLAGLTPEQALAVTHGEGPFAFAGRPGRRQDQDADSPRRLPDRDRASETGGDPGGHVQRPRRGRAAPAACRAARRIGRARRDRGDVSLGVRAASARARAACSGAPSATRSTTRATCATCSIGCCRPLRPAFRRALADHGQPGIAEVLFELSRAKNLLLSPESYERSASHPGAPLIAALWRESEAELRRSNAMDFDDLLAFGVRLLADDPHRLRWLRQRWRWILVDEFQDTSHAQATLVDLLAGPDGNLCVVGDDDQLIHAWRHADPTHILGFGERHPGHAEIVLGRNFRSRAEILQAAVSCVSHNEHRDAQGADRGAGHRRPGAGRRAGQRVPGGALGGRADRRGAHLRHAAHRDPRAGANRICDRAAAARARPPRDPAPRARLARALRAHRGARRARLPDAAFKPPRRASLRARDRLAAARRRPGNDLTDGRVGARAARGRPDRGQRARRRTRPAAERGCARAPRRVRRRARPCSPGA